MDIRAHSEEVWMQEICLTCNITISIRLMKDKKKISFMCDSQRTINKIFVCTALAETRITVMFFAVVTAIQHNATQFFAVNWLC